eukprot:Seg14856.2 transcript_id=Seg14856.2/GoldUCD/mRNA.D3Y31 product="hypothetical protein" protein_id=Seg14856.2/GoldUCD/D3Y31
MTIPPTLEGGLRIDADSLNDWMLLELICTDAANLPGAPLYDRLSSQMEKDEDWEEFVEPDIKNQFSEQITYVSRAISSAPRDEEHAGSVHITKDDAMQWYGALNQARMSLEHQHDLSKVVDAVDEEDIDQLEPHLQGALIRGRFYTTAQSLLLDYVL